jgi:hypothetical protein
MDPSGCVPSACGVMVDLTRCETVAALYLSELPTEVLPTRAEAVRAVAAAVRRFGLAVIAERGITVEHEDRLGYFEAATGNSMPPGPELAGWDAERLDWARDARFRVPTPFTVTIPRASDHASDSAA